MNINGLKKVAVKLAELIEEIPALSWIFQETELPILNLGSRSRLDTLYIKIFGPGDWIRTNIFISNYG